MTELQCVRLSKLSNKLLTLDKRLQALGDIAK